MIAGCIDRMNAGACGDCARQHACASFFSGLFGFASGRDRQAVRHGERAPESPFLAFLDQVAKAIERNVKPRENAFRKEIEQLVEPMLAAGTLRIDAVARELGYSRQTLYRRLKAEGITFGQLVETVRRRVAVRLLRDEGLSVKEAAYRLGFSDPAAFSRAFKRWTGKSPRAMRRDQPE